MRKKQTSVWQKASFFIVAVLILAITAYTAYGIYSEGNNYMRFGIDIKGGVSATFKPAGDYKPTDEQLESAKAVIEVRLDSKNILDWFATIKEKAYINLMSQYTPFGKIEKFPELNRKITTREYNNVLDYAISLGITNMYYQKQGGTEYGTTF